ncbi:MAG: hypothetical protein R3E86_14705 [Pseudomonadales bacterium]
MRMTRPGIASAAAIVVGTLLSVVPPAVHGENVMEPSLRGDDRVIQLPFGFWNESFGVAAGYVYAINGYPQAQAGLLATVMAGSKGSASALLMGQNIRLFNRDRLFFDPILSVSYYNDIDAYVDGNPDFPDERAGSNDSDPDNFITGSGWDTFYRLRFKYLLPIGDGREQLVPRYQFDRGLLTAGAGGGASFNPLESGRTFLEVRPFYRKQEVENDDLEGAQATNGMEFSVFWDNRDYPGNPSRGNALLLKLTRDWGLANSTDSWTNLAAEYDHYVSLQPTRRFRQRVLAFDVWSAYSPSWQEQPDGSIEHRPPSFAGATLGGMWRMRAFPSQRFNDKAAIYYAAELRLVPDWNIFDRWDGFQRRVGVDWIQFVGFAEAGRVASSWDLSELHDDMRWDVGLGIRAWAKGLVVRLDTAVSDEGAGVQMTVSQPFQF